MFYTIYKITNNLNGKYYIGKHQTKDLNDGYMGSGKALRNAIKKHGINNFSKDILHIFETEKEMNDKEKELVVLEESSYNLCPGGKGGFGYINENGLKIISEKHRNSARIHMLNLHKNHSEKMQAGRILAKEARRKYLGPNAFFGKKHTEETKQKMSNVHKKLFGPDNPSFGTFWVTNGSENRRVREIPLGFYKGRI